MLCTTMKKSAMNPEMRVRFVSESKCVNYSLFDDSKRTNNEENNENWIYTYFRILRAWFTLHLLLKFERRPKNEFQRQAEEKSLKYFIFMALHSIFTLQKKTPLLPHKNEKVINSLPLFCMNVFVAVCTRKYHFFSLFLFTSNLKY